MTSPDKMQIRCPRLGGAVSFGYCKRGDGTAQLRPCFKVLDCWWERFDVSGYFRQRLSREEFAKLESSRPPDKIASLVDLIRQAQKRAQGG